MMTDQIDAFQKEEHEGPSQELKDRLQLLANEMLMRMGDSRHGKGHKREFQYIGVGFDDVRLAAETRGWLTGKESGRFLSFGAGLMVGAGGVVVGRRRTKMAESQRRGISVYIHKSFLAAQTTVNK